MSSTELMTNERLSLIVVGAVFTLIGTIAVVLRSITTLQRRRLMGWDDWCMLAAYVANLGFATASFVSVRWGVGLPNDAAPAFWTTRALKAVYAVEIFYYFSIFFIKLSLLFLYLRIASHLRNILYKGTLMLMAVLVAQFVSTIVVFSLQCQPLAKYWDESLPGHCINITGFFYSTNCFTILTDLVILALPITTVMKVDRPRAQKLGVLAAFLAGALSTLASCIRLYSIRLYTHSSEPMRDAAPIDTWSFIEIDIGMLCASVAAIKPLFIKSKKPADVARRFSARSGAGVTKSSMDIAEMAPLSQLGAENGDCDPRSQSAASKSEYGALSSSVGRTLSDASKSDFAGKGAEANEWPLQEGVNAWPLPDEGEMMPQNPTAPLPQPPKKSFWRR